MDFGDSLSCAYFEVFDMKGTKWARDILRGCNHTRIAERTGCYGRHLCVKIDREIASESKGAMLFVEDF